MDEELAEETKMEIPSEESQTGYHVFIVYLVDKTVDAEKKIQTLSKILHYCGIDCNIDQYFKSMNILSWPQWISHQIESCIFKRGYILLECSEMMFNILKSSCNPTIQMAAGHIDGQTIGYYIRQYTNSFLPFCIDEDSSRFVPTSLSGKAFYIFLFSKLPELFISGDFTQDNVIQLLRTNPDFNSLNRLVATVTNQQIIIKPVTKPIDVIQNPINKFSIEEIPLKCESLMEKIFFYLIRFLPTNPYYTVCKIIQDQRFSNDSVQLNDALSTYKNYLEANEYLVWYIYRKCDYSFPELTKTLNRCFQTDVLIYVGVSCQLLEHEKAMNDLQSSKTLQRIFLEILSSFSTDICLPQKVATNQNFTKLQRYYHFLIQWMPDKYVSTIKHLEDNLSVNQIAIILDSSNFHHANKKLMEFLIERIAHKIEVLDLCDQLQNLYASKSIQSIVGELKSEIQVTESLNANFVDLSLSKYQQVFSTSELMCPFLNCFQPLPKLPSYYINRKELLEDTVKICCKSCNGTILLITGAGGFGKSTLTIALCHHELIKDKFSNHILFISLGPQADSPTVILKKLYFGLTGNSIENFTDDYLKMQLENVIAKCSHDILVIIDDVWNYDDAEPLINTFNRCHIVLTSRMITLPQLGNPPNIVNVKEMNLEEAIALLSYKLPGFESSIKDYKIALKDLAENAMLWPLLLFLIRGQLQHYLQYFRMDCHTAINSLKYYLELKGLTAFDKQSHKANRSDSVKICIEATLELLSTEHLTFLKSLILFTGIGGLFPKLALHSLWNISRDSAINISDTLYAYGLLSRVCVTLPAFCHNSRHEDYVVTHVVISKYIVDSIMTDEVQKLSPHISSVEKNHPILKELTYLFKKHYGAEDLSSLTPKEYLTYTLHLIEHVIIPYYLKMITMHALHDPHLMLLMLQNLQTILCSSEANVFFKFSEKFLKLMSKCQVLLRNSYNSNRALNKKVEQDLIKNQYTALIQTLVDYHKLASIGSVASECIELIKEIIPHAKSQLKEKLASLNESLLLKTSKYHSVNMEKLPLIKRYISLHQEVDEVLKMGGDKIHKLYKALAYEDKINQEFQFIIQNYQCILQEVAPTIKICSKPTDDTQIK